VHPLVERLHEDRPNEVLIVKRNFPLPGHANAVPAARAAEAAALQGQYEAMSDLLFTNQAVWAGLANPVPTFENFAATLGLDITQFRADMASAAVQAKIDADLATANALSLPGTPTFFLNGDQIQTPTTSAAFVALVDAEAATQTNIPATVSVLPIDAGSARVRVTPNPGFVGQFRIRVGARDAFHGGDAAAFDLAEVNVTVAANRIPQATAQTVTLNDANPKLITLAGSDGDAAIDQPLTFILTALPTQGTLTDTSGTPLAKDVNLASTQVRYVPSGNFTGTDSFAFKVRDDGGTAGSGQDTSVAATVSVRAEVNDAPTSQNQTVTVRAGQPMNITLAGTDGDPDITQTLTFQVMSLPANGTLRDSAGTAVTVGANLPTPTVTFTPNAGFTGPDQFQYRVRDDGGTANGGQDTSPLATITLQARAAQPAGDAPAPQLKRGVLSIRGTLGDDVIECELSADGTRIEVAINDAALESFPLAEIRMLKIRTGAGDDLITISPDIELTTRIRCGRGDDEATGGSGDDHIRGGRGNDMLDGGDGNDRLRGQQGDDDLLGDTGNDRLRGGRGNDTADGGPDDDRIHGGRGIDELLGSAGADLILGYLGDDILNGGDGLDTLRGGHGTDTDEDDDPLDRLFGIP
jgi:Ca2+-binding RTX toxin-like protein